MSHSARQLTSHRYSSRCRSSQASFGLSPGWMQLTRRAAASIHPTRVRLPATLGKRETEDGSGLSLTCFRGWFQATNVSSNSTFSFLLPLCVPNLRHLISPNFMGKSHEYPPISSQIHGPMASEGPAAALPWHGPESRRAVELWGLGTGQLGLCLDGRSTRWGYARVKVPGDIHPWL